MEERHLGSAALGRDDKKEGKRVTRTGPAAEDEPTGHRGAATGTERSRNPAVEEREARGARDEAALLLPPRAC